MQDVLDALWVAVPAIILISAAVQDFRTREVSNTHWMMMGITGLVFFAASCIQEYGAVPVLCHLVVSVVLLSYMLSERFSGWFALPMLLVVVILSVVSAIMTDSMLSHASVASLVVFFLFAGMYRVGLLMGGADAKCLMAVALTYPVIPEAGPLPLIWDVPHPECLLFDTSVSVLVISLFLSLASCAVLAIHNLREGRVCSKMFTTYVIGVDEARNAFVWPVENVRGGRKLFCGTLYEGKDEVLDVLSGIGENRVVVTPMIPFVLPMAIAFIIVSVLGSPLALLFNV